MDKQDGKWCGYWHEQGGALQTLARGGRTITETGDLSKISLDLRRFLGELAGPILPPPAAVVAPAGPAMSINMSAITMQPIRLGIKTKEEDGFVPMSATNMLDDEEPVDDKDTVLMSRGEPVSRPHLIMLIMSKPKV